MKNYKVTTIWIFALLMLLVGFMIVYPRPAVLMAGTILLPVLILIQAVLILRAGEESKKTFNDDNWYEDKPSRPGT